MQSTKQCAAMRSEAGSWTINILEAVRGSDYIRGAVLCDSYAPSQPQRHVILQTQSTKVPTYPILTRPTMSCYVMRSTLLSLYLIVSYLISYSPVIYTISSYAIPHCVVPF